MHCQELNASTCAVLLSRAPDAPRTRGMALMRQKDLRQVYECLVEMEAMTSQVQAALVCTDEFLV